MIIICPNCQARYEVASQTIGNAGRKVQCASCQKNWKAVGEPEPKAVEPDVLFSADEEKDLDTAFHTEEKKAEKRQKLGKKTAPETTNDGEHPGEPAESDQEKLAQKRRAMRRRQHILHRNLPRARARRVLIMTTSIMLMTLLGGGLFLRENLVRSVPELAGLYSAVGIHTNVVGLDFREVRTFKSLKNGVVVMDITAMLENTSGRQVPVPPILISLTNEGGDILYEWTVTPQASIMRKGEWTGFEAQLAAPPLDATSVRLTFVTNPARRGE